MNRKRIYYRHHRKRVIHRKMDILLSYGGKANVEAWTHGGQIGRLSKGKIHCSCPYCSRKSRIETKHRDAIRQIDAKEQLRQFDREC